MRKSVLCSLLFAASACDCGGLQTEGMVSDLQLTPELDFGTVEVGRSATLEVTLKNVGNHVISIDRFEVAAPFSTDGVATTMLAGDELVVRVTYAPTAPNASAEELHTGALVVFNDTEIPRLEVALRGHAVQPRLAASPAALDFGDVNLSAIGDLQVTVENHGSGPVNVTSAVLDSTVFRTNLRGLERRFGPGERLTFTVSYEPSAGRDDAATLRLLLDAATQPELAVPLKGRGLDQRISLCYGRTGGEQSCLPYEDASGKLIYAGQLDFGDLDEASPDLWPKATVVVKNEGNTQAALSTTASDLTRSQNPCRVAAPGTNFTFAPAAFPALLPEDPADLRPESRVTSMEIGYVARHDCTADLSDRGMLIVNVGRYQFTLALAGRTAYGDVSTPGVAWSADAERMAVYEILNKGRGTLRVEDVELVDGIGVDGVGDDCAVGCKDRRLCSALDPVNDRWAAEACSAFSFSQTPDYVDVAPQSADGTPGKGEWGMLRFVPLPNNPDAGGRGLFACARIYSDDPYDPVFCSKLQGIRLAPLP